MAEFIKATLLVDFASTSQAINQTGLLKLELDSDREGNLNGGATSFIPSDTVHYLLFNSSNVTLKTHKATNGTIGTPSGGSSGTFEVDEILTFDQSQEAILPYPIDSGLTTEKLGDVFDIDGKKTTTTVSTIGNYALRFGKPVTALLRVKYTTNFTVFKLSGVASDVPKVFVFAYGEIA